MRKILIFLVPCLITFQLNAQNDSVEFKTIKDKAQNAYSKYIGFTSTQDQTIRNFDKKTGKLNSIEEIVIDRTEYFYIKPVNKTISYRKNESDLKPSDYEGNTRDPLFLPFATDSDENYSLLFEGKKTIAKKECFSVKVIPKKKTVRHFKGYIYFDAVTFDMFYMDGTVASLPPIIMESLLIQIYFTKVDDCSVMSKAIYTTEMNIPLKYPNTKQIKTVNIRNIKLIKK